MANEITDEMRSFLYRGLRSLKSEDECDKFIDDLCTKTEKNDLILRFWAASMIKDGVKYNEIRKETGLSTATLTRINTCLKYGNGGYYTVLRNIGKM